LKGGDKSRKGRIPGHDEKTKMEMQVLRELGYSRTRTEEKKGCTMRKNHIKRGVDSSCHFLKLTGREDKETEVEKKRKRV